MQITFSVPGQPQGKGRARAVRRGAGVAHITPAKTVVYESTVSLMAKRAMLVAGLKPVALGVSVVIRAYFAVPKSWGKRQRQDALDGGVLPTGRPDLDNVGKAVLDGCNSIVWDDDSRVCDMTLHKRYSDEPRVDVVVSWG